MAASRSAEEKRFSQGPDPGLNRALRGAGAAAQGRAPRRQGREPLAGHRERPRGGEGAGAEAICFRLSGHISGRRSGGDAPRLAMQSAPDGAGRGQDQSIPPGEAARGVAVWSACPNPANKFPGRKAGLGMRGAGGRRRRRRHRHLHLHARRPRRAGERCKAGPALGAPPPPSLGARPACGLRGVPEPLFLPALHGPGRCLRAAQPPPPPARPEGAAPALPSGSAT